MAGGRLFRWALVCGIALFGACREPRELQGAIPGFRASPQQVDFGPTALHTTQSLRITLSNEGSSAYTVRALRTAAPNVVVDAPVPFEVAPGAQREVELRFTPDAEGQVAGQLEVETDATEAGEQGVAVLPMKGVGVKAMAVLSATTLDFGNIGLGTADVRPLSLTNPTEAATTVEVSLTGDDAALFSSSELGRWTLAAGETRQLPIAFAPTRLGAAEAVLSVKACSACEPGAVKLTGTGIASQLEISPVVVIFNEVTVGGAADQEVSIRNLGTDGLPFQGITLLDDGGGAFSVVSAPSVPNAELTPGASVTVRLRFAPSSAHAYRGMLQIHASKAGAPGPKLLLLGNGGVACVSIQPSSLDFGEVPSGMTATRLVEVNNRCRRDVELAQFSVKALQGGYFSLGTAASFVHVPAGARASVPVSFTPRPGSTQSTGTLRFELRDGASASLQELKLFGALGTFAPCQYQLSPASLDYARVAVGTRVVRTVTLTNTGAERCFVGALRLAAGSDAAFTAPETGSQVLEAGKSLALPIAFEPRADGLYGALVEAYLNQGVRTLPVSGEGVTSCLTFQPGTVDFGTQRVACGAKERPLVAYNRCANEVTVSAVSLQDVTSPELSLAGALSNVRVPAGASVTCPVRFTPADDGAESATVFASVTEVGDFTIGVLASGSTLNTRTDRFTQEAEARVDVLFVIDNSGSMLEEQQSLGRNFAAFLSGAQARNIDYQIGVTTTGLESSPGGWSQCPGGALGGENGRLFPVDGSLPRIITRDTPDAAAVFAQNVQVGVCHWNEQGLDAAHRALSDPLLYAADDPRTSQRNDGNGGFLRADARLAIVFLTDEEDFSTQPVGFYETFFKALKGNDPSLLSVSAIAGPENLSSCPTASSVGSRYHALAQSTGGVVESICTADWAKSLEKLSDNAFGSRRTFRLSEEPANVEEVVVTVDGVQVTTGWSYDPTLRAIVFDEAATPAPGTFIEITYPVSC